MFRRADYDYWDPYKEDKSLTKNRISSNYHYQNSPKHISNDKKIGNIIITSTSKDRKKIFQVKSNSKDKKHNNETKPRMYIINDKYFIQKKQDRCKKYNNRRLEIIPEVLNPVTPVRKSPIKIIKKTPPKKQVINIPRQMAINTTVTAPSSVATSILNNFETNPDRLLGNMTESKLDKVFKF